MKRNNIDCDVPPSCRHRAAVVPPSCRRRAAVVPPPPQGDALGWMCRPVGAGLVAGDLVGLNV